MRKILHIDASARKTRSISRALANDIKTQWQLQHPEDIFTYRDIGTTPPDCISEEWIKAAFTPQKSQTAEQQALLNLSDQLINELSTADIIILATPMYNYGMPAALKAWVDQVIRVNKTFTFDLNRGDSPLEPILSGKTLLLVTACGEFGFGVGGIRAQMNHLGPHVRTISHYLGVDKLHEIAIEYQEFGDARHAQSIENAYANIPCLIKTMVNDHQE